MSYSVETIILLRMICLLASIAALSWFGMGALLGIAPRAAWRLGLANVLLLVSIVLTIQRSSEASYWFWWTADVAGLAAFACVRGSVHQLLKLKPVIKENTLVVVLAGGSMLAVPPAPSSSIFLGLVYSVAAAWTFYRITQAAFNAINKLFGLKAALATTWPFALACALLLLRIGLIALSAVGTSEPVTEQMPENLLILWVFCGLVLLINLAMVGCAMTRLVQKIRQLADRDHLTGIWNRRAIDGHIRAEHERRLRGGAPYALVLFDLDHFKAINDRYGHDGGDAALKHTCLLVHTLLRTPDKFARYGGEEFLLLLPATELTGAINVAERMRATLVETPLVWAGTTITISASFGCVVCQSAEAIDEVLVRVDRALYEAKARGRNCVVSESLTTGQKDESGAPC